MSAWKSRSSSTSCNVAPPRNAAVFLICRLVGNLVARILERIPQQEVHRDVQLRAVGRDRLQEPLLVELLRVVVEDDVGHRAVDHALELHVVLAEHDRVGLDRQQVAHHGVVGRALGVGTKAVEQHVVHGKGIGAAGGHHAEGLGVVLGLDHVDLQHARFGHGADLPAIGAAARGNDGLAVQVFPARDAGAGLHQHAAAGDVVRDGEGHLLAPLARVVGGAAFQVGTAFLDGGDARGGRHRHVLHLQVGPLEFRAQLVDHAQAQVQRVADGLLVGVEVRERDGTLAMREADGAGVADAVEHR